MDAPFKLADVRITIIGLGLMGGSLALALRGRCRSLFGVEPDAESREAALARQVVDQAAAHLDELPCADLLLLAAPVGAILHLLGELPALHPAPAVVLDIGSTKQAIVQAMQTLPAQFDPLGGHPMCGKAAGGLAEAEAGLYQNAVFALTALDRTTPAARALAAELVAAVGARPLWLNAAIHDEWVAATSHLAYLSSSALAAAVPNEAAPLVGPGLRSAARLASSPASMMQDVLESNRPAVLAALARLRAELASLEQALQQNDHPALAALLERNAAHQRTLFQQPAAEPASKVAGPFPSARLQRLPGNFFAQLERSIRRLQAEGVEVVRLDIGSPDLPPPPAVIRALAEDAARPDAHGYQPHNGVAPLRQAWSEYYGRLYGVALDPENQVMPLMGTKEGIFHLAQALLNPGEVALAPDPGYMTYSRGAWFAGAEFYPLPLRAENHFLPDFADIPTGVLRRARLLWLNYPNNPTGAVASLDFFARALAFADRHGILLCHDAAYARVGFDGYEAPSLLQVPGAAEQALEFNSLSKSHNLAGWRTGAALGNPRALKLLLQMKTHLDSGGFRPVQRATIAALETPGAWLSERNLVYQRRRDRVLQALPALGLRAEAPKGSIYVWAALPPGETCQSYVERALAGAGVSLAPGTVFGPAGEGFVRIALSTPDAGIERAMQLLEHWAA